MKRSILLVSGLLVAFAVLGIRARQGGEVLSTSEMKLYKGGECSIYAVCVDVDVLCPSCYDGSCTSLVAIRFAGQMLTDPCQTIKLVKCKDIASCLRQLGPYNDAHCIASGICQFDWPGYTCERCTTGMWVVDNIYLHICET